VSCTLTQSGSPLIRGLRSPSACLQLGYFLLSLSFNIKYSHRRRDKNECTLSLPGNVNPFVPLRCKNRTLENICSCHFSLARSGALLGDYAMCEEAYCVFYKSGGGPMLSPKETARSACEHFSFHIINSEVHPASMFELAGVPLFHPACCSQNWIFITFR
jgi:hypothetical protein